MIIAVAAPPAAEPAWIQQPSADELARARTGEAAGSRAGDATFTCYVLTDGRLDACRSGGASVNLPFFKSYRLDPASHPQTVSFTLRLPKLYDTPPQIASAPSAETLRALRTSGMATVNCSVAPDGRSSDCRAANPVRDPEVASAAERAAALYAFKPALLDRRPVAAMIAVTINFDRGGLNLIEQPNWLEKPSGADLERAYPKEALRSNLSGKAAIRCEVLATGRLDSCIVVSESPPATGFGEAAIQIAGKFKMKPLLVNGEAQAGGQVVIPINFRTDGPTRRGETFSQSGAGGQIKLATWMPFSEAPTPEQVAAAAPAKAKAAHTYGHTSLRCGLSREGRLEDCVSLGAEDPNGFDEAAKTLAKLFKVDLGETPPKSIRDVYLPVAFDFTDRTMIPSSERYVRQPDFTRKIDPARVVAAYPAEAVAAGVLSGGATVDCRIGAGGELKDCLSVTETAPGLGFAASAVAVAQVMRVNLWTRDGEPTVGAKLRLPLKFIYSGESSSSPAAAPPR